MRKALPWLSLPIAASLSGCPDYSVTRLAELETFNQLDGNLSVDFVWVMDNSGTMSEEQASVVSGLEVFIDILESFGADWQVGVITTDAEGETAGQIIGPVLTPLESDVEAAFAEALDVGSDGAITEAGLEAMRLATTDPLKSGANAGLLRDTSDLAVVVVSDEDDQSPLATTEYVAHLDALKGAGHARVSAIVGDLPAGCATPYAAADPGLRYRDVVDATGGYADTICRRDFSDTMEALALNGLGLTDTFYLAQVPEPPSIEVAVAGIKIYQRPQNGWQYDPGANAIVFDGYAIPGPGAQVVVTYFAWAGTSLETTDEASTGDTSEEAEADDAL